MSSSESRFRGKYSCMRYLLPERKVENPTSSKPSILLPANERCVYFLLLLMKELSKSRGAVSPPRQPSKRTLSTKGWLSITFTRRLTSSPRVMTLSAQPKQRTPVSKCFNFHLRLERAPVWGNIETFETVGPKELMFRVRNVAAKSIPKVMCAKSLFSSRIADTRLSTNESPRIFSIFEVSCTFLRWIVAIFHDRFKQSE
mmetsp:Transcript_16301/g.37270  ORF Transcript_16301/g.37270 Transcript_16301/m.37270 type:complete len:200 (-) Transcript_16301:45-644(-)